jgi:uncharacterized protein YndB with AHSA1/START domain
VSTAERRPAVELHLERLLTASRQRVFDLLTEPGELARWWGPHGFTTPEIALDLRVGGSFRFTMQPPDGDPFHLSGEFLEIDPPIRVAYTFRWDEPVPDDRETTVRLSLEAAGGATRVLLSHGEFATAERLELHRSGWTDSFERLSALLASGPDRPRPPSDTGGQSPGSAPSGGRSA